jgi:hypothetical protein
MRGLQRADDEKQGVVRRHPVSDESTMGAAQAALALDAEDIMRTTTRFRTAGRLLSAIAIAVLVAACGGGDDDGGGGGTIITDDQAPPMPTTVSFNVGTKDAARLAISADSIGFSYPQLAFAGTWNRTANTWTLRGSTEVDSGPQLFGSFSARAVEPLQFFADDTPAAGTMEFVAPLGNSFIPAGATMQVKVGANVVVTNMVNLIDHTYDWDTFLSMWIDATQHPTERLASFGTTTAGLVADRGKMVLDLMATINANDLRISATGGYVTACSPRPGAATGTRTIALANQDGQLNPGDTIIVTYRDCWIDDPTDDIDLLWNGTITMSGYVENKSPFSTGFEEIRFNGLAEYETITSAGTVTVEPLALVTNGTMTLFVTP